jgi:hypothetical protein
MNCNHAYGHYGYCPHKKKKGVKNHVTQYI